MSENEQQYWTAVADLIKGEEKIRIARIWVHWHRRWAVGINYDDNWMWFDTRDEAMECVANLLNWRLEVMDLHQFFFSWNDKKFELRRKENNGSQ